MQRRATRRGPQLNFRRDISRIRILTDQPEREVFGIRTRRREAAFVPLVLTKNYTQRPKLTKQYSFYVSPLFF